MFAASCELPSAYLHICYLRVLLLLVAVREVAALYVLWRGGLSPDTTVSTTSTTSDLY